MSPQLTKHFSLAELIPPNYKEQHVPVEIAANLQHLCIALLEPIREWAGSPLIIHSGWRPDDVNKLAGGVTRSDHLSGRAADFHVQPASELDWDLLTIEAFHWARLSLSGRFGQIILEDHRLVLKEPAKLWVHISIPSQRHPGALDSNAVLVSDGPGHYEVWREATA